jgi:hypothetical protein
MRELNVRLPSRVPIPRGNPWREAFSFLASFLAVFLGSVVVLDHAAAVLL